MSEDKADTWMPLWIGEYMADTMTFTTAQHGAYLLLIMAYWRERAPLPDSDEALRAITRMSRPEWAKARPVLARKFRVADGVWWHKRVEHEMKTADERSKKATEKAEKAAQARWGKKPEHAASDAPSIPQALHDQCPPPSPSSSSLRSEQTEPNGSGAAGAAKPKVTDPNEIIFGYGVPLLVSAGSADKAARSFLGGLRKVHGDAAVVDGLRACIKAKPLQPLEWLAAALPPKPAPGKQSALEARNAATVAKLIAEDAHATE